MNVEKLIADLRARDIVIWIDDERLRFSAPPGVMTDALRNQLAEHREVLRDWMLASKSSEQYAALRIEPVDRDGELPLSFAQERLWFIEQLESNSAAYNIAVALTLRGALDVVALTRSFESVVRRHEVLRSRVATHRHGPGLQFISRDEFRLPVVPVPESGDGEVGNAVRAAVQQEIGTPFNLSHDRLLRARLFQLPDDEHVLVVVLHHMVFDAWSLGVLFREVGGYYREIVTGETYAPPPLPIQYVDYAAWQRSASGSARFEKQFAYWRERLSGLAPLELPTDRAQPATPSNHSGSESFTIEGQLLEQCRKLCRQHRVTPFVLILAVLKILLSRYTETADIAVGTPIAGRNTPDVENLIGCFLNTIVLRTDLSGSPSFDELLSRVHQTSLEGQANQDAPFERVLQVLELDRSLGRNPLFQVWFNFLDLGGATPELEGLIVNHFDSKIQYSKFDLSCYVYSGSQQLTISLGYATDLFETETIRGMLRHFRNLLMSALADSASSIDRLCMLDDGDHAALDRARERIPSIDPGGSIDWGILDAVADRSATDPEHIGIATPDESLTMGELDGLSDRIARDLASRHSDDPEPGRVGLLFERPARMVAAMLGVMKAGHAYLPLDAAAPITRLSRIVDDAEPCVIITEDHLADLARSLGGSATAISCWTDAIDFDHHVSQPPEAPGLDAPAYLIYTSGSTGQPKGVLQTHRGLMHHARAFVNALQLTSCDRLSMLSGFSFDTAQQDIFAALLSGATLCTLNLREVDTASAHRWLDDQALSVVHTTPTVFRHLFSAVGNGRVFDSVRAVVLGGEQARASDLTLYREHFSTQSVLINGLGATECTTALQYHIDSQTSVESGRLAIGVALPGTELLLLDATGRETEVLGEITIVGVPAGTCYWRNESETERRFRPAPGPGERMMYLTGDIGRRRADGNIVFQGRRDDQIKLRGMRVELNEVETALVQHDAINAAALAVAVEADDEFLVAACVMRHAAEALDPNALRASLRETLPEYMIPTRIIALEALPLTASGKIDRKTLCNLVEVEATVSEQSEVSQPAFELQRLIADVWQQVLGLESVGLQRNFFDLGGHSLLLVEVRARLEEVIGHKIPMPDLFQYPTVASLAGHLDTQHPKTAPRGRRVAAGRGKPDDEAIAIIAMSARLPGAANLDEFWLNLCSGLEIIERVNSDALIADGLDVRLVNDPRFVPVHSSITDVEMFDADFFGYTPREAELMDPQQRLFLECAMEALERAGCDPQRHAGAIGVFAGAGMTNYLFNLLQRPDLIRASGGWQAVIRSDKDYLPMRVSYKLNLRGPSIDVQTACSTSLVAVHEARNSLLRYDCDMALAGGVTLRFPRHAGYMHEEGGILSPDGHCRPFDAKGAGTVFGEGVGVVVLKRLSEALADGDPIRAVIRGTAVNNDGSDKVGFTAPSVSAQAELVAQAHAAAGVEASSIGYVEAHGTGTSLGDPIEVSALHQAFEGAPRGSCALGAVKSNIGHLDRAAGIAGLMKTVLMLEHGEIPPSLHYEEANPEIDFEAGPFYVNTQLKPWERVDGQPRRAGVSSFGMGGTNAHVVLEEAPELAASDASRRWQVLVVSAKNEAALAEACANLADHLEQHPDEALADVAYTLQVGRTGFERRVAVVSDDLSGAIEALRKPDAVRSAGEVRDGRAPEVVFLYPGQGTQYPNMGRELYEVEAVYREAVDECCERLAEALGLDLRTLLYPQVGDEEAAGEALKRTSLTQPALFVTEYALTQLLAEWGIRPVAMVGHSIGELVAACVSGVLDRDAALRLVTERGRLMEEAPSGVMVSVLASAEQARVYEGEGIWLSVVNGPQASVLSCTHEASTELEARLEADGLAYQRLQTSHAFHCGLMDNVLGPLDAVSEGLSLAKPQVAYVSNVTGDWVDGELDAGYWSRQVRAAVRFDAGVETVLARHPDAVLLEVGPGQALSQLVRGVSKDKVAAVVRTQAGAKDKGTAGEWLARGLGELWCAGVAVDWAKTVGAERRLKVALPTYPFQRKRYWVEPGKRTGVVAPALERNADIADWFYVPTWQRALPPPMPNTRHAIGCWLLIGENSELVRELAISLREAGHKVSIAHAGTHFGSNEGEYSIRPAAGEDFDALLEQLAERSAMPDHVVHLWAATDDAALDPDEMVTRCFYAPMNLVQSLGRRGHDAPLQITFVSNQMQEVTGAEDIFPEKATLIGPCRVVPLEYPNIVCRSVDLGFPTHGDLESLLGELYLQTPDAFVAYRHDYRWTPRHLPSPLDAVDGTPPLLRQGGVYLVTGGLGGIGLTLAGYLAESCKARLVLVTRSGLPPEKEWDLLLAGGQLDETQATRIRAVRGLEAAGAQVMVVAADVCSREDMIILMERIQEKFGAMNGVIHAAGIAGGGVIQMKTAAAANEVLEPKLRGGRILADLLRDKLLDFMLLCSSVNALFGVPGQVDYCAANAYLDALAVRQRRDSGTFTVSVNWDTWRDVGMAVDTEVPAALARQRRLSLTTAITPSEGAQAFARVITSGWPQVLVTPRPGTTEDVQIAPAPQSEPDANVLGSHERPELDGDYVEPSDELERQIVLIWRELFGLDRVGVADNFLELGGHSLLATQLLARLRSELGVDWALDVMFTAPTVAEQAQLVRDAKPRLSSVDAISAQAKRIKEMSSGEREALLAKARQARTDVI